MLFLKVVLNVTMYKKRASWFSLHYTEIKGVHYIHITILSVTDLKKQNPSEVMSAPNHILAHRLELASALQLDWRAERVQFDLVVFFNKAKLLCFPGKQVNLFTAFAILLKNSLSIPILLHYTMQARLLIGNSLG